MNLSTEYSIHFLRPSCLKTRFGYGQNFNFYKPSENFRVYLPHLQRRPQSPFFEAQQVAREIANLFLPSKILLCLSGGLDSEAMALAFLAAHIPFSVATFKMRNGLNSEESVFADRFCQHFQIQQYKFELNCEKFYESGRIFDFADPYIPFSPELATQIWFLQQLGSPFVWAGEAFRVFQKNRTPIIQAVSEIEGVYERYLQLSGHEGISNFHFCSAELAWSFFQSSLTFSDKRTLLESSYLAYEQKFSFYKYCGFPLLDHPERKRKLHGFEQFKKYIDKKHNDPLAYQRLYREPFKKKYPMNGTSLVQFSPQDLLVHDIMSLRLENL